MCRQSHKNCISPALVFLLGLAMSTNVAAEQVEPKQESPEQAAPAGDQSTAPSGDSPAAAPVAEEPVPVPTAAEPVPPAVHPEQDSVQLEEVVVTARRMEENAQTVPIAITVVSEQALQDNNVLTIGDLQYLVPSMSADTTAGRDSVSVSIRGQGQTKVQGPAGVVSYINEVPIPVDFYGRLAGGPGLFFDLANVQVLKGPQGTLFGRNSVGGALLLQTARPKEEPGGRLQLGYGSHHSQEIDGAIDLPIVDEKLLMRVAFNGQKREGFTRLLGTPAHPNGIDADDRDFWSVRASVAFVPTDWFRNDAIVTYSEYDSNGTPFILTELNPTGVLATVYPGLVALFAQQQSLGVRTVIPSSVNLVSSGENLFANNLTLIKLGEILTFRNILGYVRTNRVITLDVDASAFTALDIISTPRDDTIEQFTEEIQLLGKSFGGRLDWIVGGFYLDVPLPDDFVFATQTSVNQPLDYGYKKSQDSKAIFAQGNYDLSAVAGGLSVTAGLRYTRDSLSDRGLGAQAGEAPPVVCIEPRVQCSNILVTEVDYSALTWTFGLDYRATSDTLLYFASRRGFRAGGSNGNDPGGNLLPQYDPEFVTDFELGLKSDWSVANVPVRTNAAVYYQDYSNIQVSQVSFVNNAFRTITGNAASARVVGAELDATAQLTKNLQVGATFAYIDFKVEDVGASVTPAQVVQLDLLRTYNRPPYKYGVNVLYHLPLAAEVGDVAVQANWNWQDTSGARFLQIGGLVPSFGVLNLSANWDRIGGAPIDASFFISNATDEEYTQGGFDFYNQLGITVETFGEPRMYGFRLRYRFGGER
jgi:iron complex outermembrane receptor protein